MVPSLAFDAKKKKKKKSCTLIHQDFVIASGTNFLKGNILVKVIQKSGG